MLLFNYPGKKKYLPVIESNFYLRATTAKKN